MQQAAQVYFPVSLYVQIKARAAEEGKPMAAWVRDLVAEEIEGVHKKKKPMSQMKTFSWSDDPTISQRIDEIVYGHP